MAFDFLVSYPKWNSLLEITSRRYHLEMLISCSLFPRSFFSPRLSSDESTSKLHVLYALSCDGKPADFPGLVKKFGLGKAGSCLGSTMIPEVPLDKLGSKSDLRPFVELVERHRSFQKAFIRIR